MTQLIIGARAPTGASYVIWMHSQALPAGISTHFATRVKRWS